MNKPLPTQYLVEQWRFRWADAVWGVDNGWAEPALLVELAVKELLSDADASPEAVLLAGLSSPVGEQAVSLARNLAASGECRSDDSVRRNWLYLALRWVFDTREQRTDPLGDVEEIYCAFGHPRSIEHLVRYMPPDGYDPRQFTPVENEQRLFRQWEHFLHGEESTLSV